MQVDFVKTCSDDEICQAGECVCAPDCEGRVCGDDSCGGSCGTCLEGEPHEAATTRMLQSTGRAVRWNATVLALGFLVLTLSALKPNHSLGLLLAAAMCACYATSLLFLPWLLRDQRP